MTSFRRNNGSRPRRSIRASGRDHDGQFFLVIDGALPGVIRAEVVTAAGAGERSLKPEDLAGASEAFVTNCLGIRALVSVDGAPIGDGRPGPVFEKFRAIA